MNKILTVTLLGVATAFACPAYAQTVQVGQACQGDPANLQTSRSVIASQGVVECIPDSAGNYSWQPMGAGIARYDATPACNIAGTVRWNGSAIQYCNGASWQSLGGAGGAGKLYWDGNWTGDRYWCDPGYHIVAFHYDCGCSNNANWVQCQSN